MKITKGPLWRISAHWEHIQSVTTFSIFVELKIDYFPKTFEKCIFSCMNFFNFIHNGAVWFLNDEVSRNLQIYSKLQVSIIANTDFIPEVLNVLYVYI